MNGTDCERIISGTEQTLLAYCKRQGLFKPGDRVIAACSGGADSVALLLFLLRCRRELSIEMLATHVDHGLRGEASQEDARFVARLCQKKGVELFLYDARRAGVTIPDHPGEDWARRLRYAWFDELAAREEAKIATAHTLSDQAETVLLRLARGTGLHGLGGIRPQRGVYRRPLLCLSRAETEAYCAALGQRYVQDETNDTGLYARNRVRQGAVPALQSVNPSAERCIARLCAQMQELDSWLTGEAAALLQAAATPRGYDIQTLREAEGPVLDAALHSLVAPVRDAEEKYVSLLRFLVLKGEGALQLTADVSYRVQKYGGDKQLVRISAAGALPPPAPPQPALPGVYRLPGGYVLSLQVEKYEDFLKNAPIFKKDLTCCADYAKINRNVLLRTRRPGDDYRPCGRHVRKTLKKYYNEIAVPTAERPLLPLLADGSEVLWLWGSGFAEGLAPDDYTREVLIIRTEKTEGT